MESTLDHPQADVGDVEMADLDWLEKVWLCDEAVEGLKILTSLRCTTHYRPREDYLSHSQYLDALFWAMEQRSILAPAAQTWFKEHAHRQKPLSTGDILREALEAAERRNSYAIVVARKCLACSTCCPAARVVTL